MVNILCFCCVSLFCSVLNVWMNGRIAWTRLCVFCVCFLCDVLCCVVFGPKVSREQRNQRTKENKMHCLLQSESARVQGPVTACDPNWKRLLQYLPFVVVVDVDDIAVGLWLARAIPQKRKLSQRR